MNFPERLKQAAKILLNRENTLENRPPIPAITEDEVAEAKAFFPMDKFFVYGHARSGTTLLMRLLDVHPEVHCSRQAHFFTRPPYLHGLVDTPEIAEWLSRGSVRWNRGQDLSPVVLRAAADFILERDARQHGATIVGDKSPNSLNDGQAIDLTHRLYPDAKIIFIVRDGRDAVLSHRFQAFIDAPQHLSPEDNRIREAFQQNPDQFRAPDRSLFTEQGLREYAHGWVRNLESTTARGQSLFGDTFYHLLYEDLLASPLPEMLKVWGFLDANPEKQDLDQLVEETIGLNRDARWQKQKAGDLAEAIPKGQAGGWQIYFSARDRAIFKEIAGKTLITWQYEKNLDW